MNSKSQVYISLLRGINVAGQKIIKMADLRAIYQALSLTQVQSYIQSGNLVFQSDISDSHQLSTTIKQAILKHYKFDVPIFILTPNALRNARNNLPFQHIDIEQESSRILVCFLSDVASNSADLLRPYLKSNEQLEIIDNVLYLYCQDGVGRSKLTHSHIEKQLNANATLRNLKTINKLIDLAENNT